MRPDVAPLTDDIYQDLGPLPAGDEDNGWALLHLLNAVFEQHRTIDELSRPTDTEPAWAHILDVDNTPAIALPWLAQFVGVRLPDGLTEQQQRDRIKDRASWKRGRPEVIINVVEPLVPGGWHRVELVERDTSPYHFTVRVYRAQLGIETYQQNRDRYATYALRLAGEPDYDDHSVDFESIHAAVDAVKPAGLQWSLHLADGATYGQMLAEFPTYAVVGAAFGTYDDQIHHIPGS